MTLRLIAAGSAVWLAAMAAVVGQKPLARSAMRNHPSIRYQEASPRDPIAALDARLLNGDLQLAWEPGTDAFAASSEPRE